MDVLINVVIFAGDAGPLPGGELGRTAPEARPLSDPVPVLSEGGRAADGGGGYGCGTSGRYHCSHHAATDSRGPPCGRPGSLRRLELWL